MDRFITDIFANPLKAIICIVAALFLAKLFKIGKSIFRFCFFLFIAWLMFFGLGG